MPRGGRREGAGRKPKSEQVDREIEVQKEVLSKELPDYIENLRVLARGVLVERVNPKPGQEPIYRKPPDRRANEYLLNRVMGRPTEKKNVNVDLEGNVRITGIEVDL